MRKTKTTSEVNLLPVLARRDSLKYIGRKNAMIPSYHQLLRSSHLYIAINVMFPAVTVL